MSVIKSANSNVRAIATVDQFLASVRTKSAAAPLSEPGSIGGETSHPVKNVEDGLQAAVEGARSAENKKDVKADQGAPSVDSTAAKAAALLKRSENGGSPTPNAEKSVLKVEFTGDDPSNETSKAKGGKDDPGSASPARTDNNQLEGGKYAFDANASTEKLASLFKEAADDFCAEVALSYYSQPEKQASSSTPAPAAQPAPQVKQAQPNPQLAAQVGWEIAGLIDGTMDKVAADQMAREEIAFRIKRASTAADLLGDYLIRIKQAEGLPPEAMAGAGGPPPGAGGPPGADPGAMMGALGGGAPAGGPPPGGDPGAGAGGPPPGSGGGEMTPEIAAAISQALEMNGITPQDLLQMLTQGEGGAGGGAGGPPPGAGGPPPGAGGPPAGDGDGDEGGGAPPKEEKQAAHKKQSKASLTDEMARAISEVIQRSRQ